MAADHALGVALADAHRQLAAAEPRALRAALEDLLEGNTLLAQPLRHLISLPGFARLQAGDSQTLRLASRDALLQELRSLYLPAVITRVAAVLDGYLGMALEAEISVEAQQRHGNAELVVSSPAQVGRLLVAKDLLAKGIEEACAGNHNSAIESHRESIRHDPTSPEAYYHLALSMSKRGEHRESLDWLAVCLVKDSSFADAYLLRGKERMHLKMLRLAEEDFAKCIALKPDCADAYHQRGLLLAARESLDEALVDISKAADMGHQDACDWMTSFRSRPQKSTAAADSGKRGLRQKSHPKNDLLWWLIAAACIILLMLASSGSLNIIVSIPIILGLFYIYMTRSW